MTTESPLADSTLIKEGVTSVSFALFGTLLLRRSASVEGVYERTLHYAPVPERLKLMPDTFVQHRTLAQNTLRIGRGKRERDMTATMVSGVSIEAIYNQFAVHALNLPRSLRGDLIAAELKAEQELCFVNPDVADFYLEARRQGRRVGIVAETHWSAEQVRVLLSVVAPDLAPDFIYTSASAEVIEAGGLFRFYLGCEHLAPERALHIGVDEDTVEQSTLGVPLIRYCLPEDSWKDRSGREETAARLLAMSDKGFTWRLDGGLKLLRRLALAEMGASAPHHAVAGAVLGPVMVGFQRLIEDRIAELSGPGKRVVVAFLARDGYLPMRIWNAAAVGRAEYVEVNRRIAMVAASEGAGGFETLRGLLAAMPFISVEGIESFFKITVPDAVHAYFAERDKQMATGQEFAEQMEELLGRDLLKEVSDNLRASLMEYLETKLGSLSDYTDLILVDIGYTGNIQKGLRRVFDVEGLGVNLHGIYLMPHGESFAKLPDGDSVAGYFDDTVMTPAAKRGLMRDAPLLEEFCCAPVGSTRGYENGREIREEDVRLSHEITFCLEMQDECVRYFDAFHRLSKHLGLDPLADFPNYRAWTAAYLSRFVIMPTPLECQTFGPLLHDVSLGSRGLIATITTADIRKLMGALPFPAVASIHHPPVWLGGSMAAHTAAAGFSYATAAFGMGVDDFFRDVDVGDIEATIIKDENGITVPVTRSLTPFGDVRLRIPVLQRDSESIIAISLKAPLARGVIRSCILQGGANIEDATNTRYGERQPLDGLLAMGATLDGNYFRALQDNAFLLVPVPAFKHSLAVMTVLISPLFDE